MAANPSLLVRAATKQAGATFQTSRIKLYVPVVTFSINNNIEFLENINQGFKEQLY